MWNKLPGDFRTMDNSILLESSFEVSRLPELPSLVRIDRNNINLKLVKSLHMSDHEVMSVGEYRLFVKGAVHKLLPHSGPTWNSI